LAKIIIVNEKDEVIDYKERGTLNQEDIYRVSGLWIENSKGEILLAQRGLHKKNDPGKWGPAVAGTVEEGETYDSNIIKEAEEEIGLKGKSFKKLDKVRRKGKHNYFCQWFFLSMDDYDFKVQKEEVEQIKWFKRNELLADFQKNPDSFLKSVRDFLHFP
jgi:isopentenyldiphosphate isomerase